MPWRDVTAAIGWANNDHLRAATVVVVQPPVGEPHEQQ